MPAVEPSTNNRFVTVSLFALLLFFALRGYELVLFAMHNEAPKGMLMLSCQSFFHDTVFAFGIFFILAIPNFILGNFSALLAHIFQIASLFTLLLIGFALGSYFATTYVPLGLDLFGYSLSEIIKTVGASTHGVNYFSVVFLIFLILFLFWSGRVAKKFYPPSSLIVLFYLMSFLSLPLIKFSSPVPSDYKKESEYFVVVNKSQYFFTKLLTKIGGTHIKALIADQNEYPLLKNADYTDTLGQFFNLGEKPPNLVFIVVEGLGASFMEGGTYSGFTPFLDSLSHKSLYWKNFLSTSGRTFGVIPSLFGSLPYGDAGFMNMGAAMPDHMSLLSLLKQNGYTVSFLYGGDADFDRRLSFFKRQNVDHVISQDDFSDKYQKTSADENGFSWGYPDDALFKVGFEHLAKNAATPRMDVYLTLSTHEPFIFPNQTHYLDLFKSKLATLSAERRERVAHEGPALSSLLYADEAIQNFLIEYEKQPSFANTIFFITGDHRMIPLPHDSKIDRFHVPFLIYSPLLKEPKQFLSVSTHLDVTPSILALLKNKYAMNFPDKVHWLGEQIDTSPEFRSTRKLAFMRAKNEIIDYLSGNQFFSGDLLTGEQAFELRPDMDLEELQDEGIKDSLRSQLNVFRKLNDYVCFQNKLLPVQQSAKKLDVEIDEALRATLSPDERNKMFADAQSVASAEKYDEAQKICEKILTVYPEDYDVRSLLGHILAWQQKYEEALGVFKDLIRQAPKYADAYAGVAQIYFWTEKLDLALNYVDRAIEITAKNDDTLLLKAKILRAKKQDAKAMELVDEILRRNPSMTDALSFKKGI